MFGNDKTVENLQDLYNEVKKYVELQRDYIKLDIVQKLTILISALVLLLAVMILGMIALFYLSFTLAYVLEPHVGGLTMSYAIISGCILLLIACIYFFRQHLIIQPLTRFLTNLFINDK